MYDVRLKPCYRISISLVVIKRHYYTHTHTHIYIYGIFILKLISKYKPVYSHSTILCKRISSSISQHL